MQAVKSKLNTAGTQVGGALPFAASHDNPVERSSRKGGKGEEDNRGNTSEDQRTRFAENTRHAGEATGEDAQKKLDRKVLIIWQELMHGTRIWNARCCQKIT